MPMQKKFLDRARKQLKALRSELNALERSPATGKAQLQKLWDEWQALGASLEKLATAPARRSAALNQLKADAESHWLALEVVVAAHRDLAKGHLAHA